MLFQYANALVGFVFGLVFVVFNVFVLVRLLAPNVPNEIQKTTYECGEPPVGSAWVRFDMRFYTMALIFIIFEVEAVFLFPWAVAYNDLIKLMDGNLFAFVEMALFVTILGVGLIYVWRKGDMDWVKSSASQPQVRPSNPPVGASTEAETREVA